MASEGGRTWLLLIHQIPPQPNALRVKIWRRLQQVGAVAVKQSVYAMPLSEQAREDLVWILQEIVAGGGEGSLSEARFLAGLSDAQIISQFREARRADYEKILHEGREMLAAWSSGHSDPRDPDQKGPAHLARLRRKLEDVAAIDFFQAPQRAVAELQLRELAGMLAGRSPAVAAGSGSAELHGKVWVTRGNLFVDRLACGWLIRRFVDPAAVFKFVATEDHVASPNEVRFDMFQGDFTHEGDLCTFEVMLRRLGLDDAALTPLTPLAELVHDIDLKDNRHGRPETAGLQALLSGLAASQPDDTARLEESLRVFDGMYAYFQGRRSE